MTVLCARCNAPLTCTPEGNCWCKQLPPTQPVPPAEAATRCLCPACLVAATQAREALPYPQS